MLSKKSVFAFVLLLCVVVPGVAQTKSDEDTVRISTNLVQVDAVVTKNGKMVTDLKAEDFEIFEDGRRQVITSFAFISNVPNNGDSTSPATNTKDTNLPFDPKTPPPLPPEVKGRTIAIVIDDLGLSAESMAQMRRQLRTFIDEQLNPNDQLAIVMTSKAYKGEQPRFTNDKRVTDQAWEQTVWYPCSRAGVKTMPKLGGPSGGAGCNKYSSTPDQSYRAIRLTLEAMAKLSGRKSMVVFSDSMPLREDEQMVRPGGSVTDVDGERGDTNNYMGSLNKLTEAAIRGSVVIYAVDAGGLQVTSLTAADEFSSTGASGIDAYKKLLHGRSAMIDMRRDAARIISQRTGGYLVKDQNNFQLDGILNDQQGYYLIGYRPSTETFNKRFHNLKARVKKSGMTVRTRSGFFGMSEQDAKRLKEANRKD